MDITLKRYQSNNDGAFGRLTIGGKVFASVERPWFNNQPMVSCVPAGKYLLVPHKSNKHGDVLCMINEDAGVTHFREIESKRYACLIHVANYVREVNGCIGLGHNHVGSMVTNSRKSLAEFHELVSPYEEHTLLIEWGEA